MSCESFLLFQPEYAQFLFNDKTVCRKPELHVVPTTINLKFRFALNVAQFTTLMEPHFNRVGSVIEFEEEYYFESSMLDNKYFKRVINKSTNEENWSYKEVKLLSPDNETKFMHYTTTEISEDLFPIVENERAYMIKMFRMEYELKENPLVRLKFDQITFGNFDRAIFTLHSLVAKEDLMRIINEKTFHHCNSTFGATLRPCRSKIFEILFMENKSLYEELLKRGYISNIEYLSESFKPKRKIPIYRTREEQIQNIKLRFPNLRGKLIDAKAALAAEEFD